MLEVNNISKRFGGLLALSDITFGVGSGEIVSLIGPNGAGKTTCLNLITGFFKPSAGRAFIATPISPAGHLTRSRRPV